MSSDRVLAGRYARAIFLAASGSGQEQKLGSELSGALAVFRDNLSMIGNPRVPAADKKRRIREALGAGASPLFLRFLELLIDKKRSNLLPFVAADADRLLAEKNNTAKAQVRSALPLSVEEKQRLKKKLEDFSGKNIDLETREDEGLIGGVVVRLGDWVFDASLRGKLYGLREAMNGD